MTHKAVTLAHGVALFSFVLENKLDISKLDDQLKMDIVHYVKHVYNDLLNAEKKHLLEIPSTSCSVQEPILYNNDPFFIAHTLVEKYRHNSEKMEERLIKHLNNCYSCFQAYSHFFKDYYQARQEIRQSLGD